MAKQRFAAQAGLVAAGAVFIFCLIVLFSQGGDKTATLGAPTPSAAMAQTPSPAPISVSLAQP